MLANRPQDRRSFKAVFASKLGSYRPLQKSGPGRGPHTRPVGAKLAREPAVRSPQHQGRLRQQAWLLPPLQKSGPGRGLHTRPVGAKLAREPAARSPQFQGRLRQQAWLLPPPPKNGPGRGLHTCPVGAKLAREPAVRSPRPQGRLRQQAWLLPPPPKKWSGPRATHLPRRSEACSRTDRKIAAASRPSSPASLAPTAQKKNGPGR